MQVFATFTVCTQAALPTIAGAQTASEADNAIREGRNLLEAGGGSRLRRSQVTMTRLTGILLVVFAALMQAKSAAADAATDADTAFREGRELLETGKYQEACEKFELSEQLDPAVATLLNLEACYEAQGRTATAWTKYNEAADMATRNGEGGRGAKIRARARALEKRLSKVLVHVIERPEGLRVTRSGNDVTSLLDTPVPLDPGDYVYEARAPGYEVWRQDAKVIGRGTLKIEIALIATGAETSAAATEGARPSTTTPRPFGAQPRQKLGLRLSIGGGISVLVGLALGLNASSDWNGVKARCGADLVCAESDYDDARRLLHSTRIGGNTATALVGVGLVSAAAGAVLMFFHTSDHVRHAQLRVEPAIGIGEASVVATGTFW